MTEPVRSRRPSVLTLSVVGRDYPEYVNLNKGMLASTAKVSYLSERSQRGRSEKRGNGPLDEIQAHRGNA